MECAFFGVPTVTLYKTSWLTYQIARRIVTVKSLTMPNLLAGEEVFPEFIQHDATPENISRAALELLQDESRRQKSKRSSQNCRLAGEPGAGARGGSVSLFHERPVASVLDQVKGLLFLLIGIAAAILFSSTIRAGKPPICSRWRSGVSAGFIISRFTSSEIR